MSDIMHLEIHGWDAGITFSACHFIPGHDKCSRLHGHNYAISARVYGKQDKKGMIMDFIELKSALKDVAAELDHRVLIPGDSKEMTIEIGDSVNIKVKEKEYVFPCDDVVVMDISLASAEQLAGFILDRFLALLKIPGNVDSIHIGLDEGKGQGAWVEKKL